MEGTITDAMVHKWLEEMISNCYVSLHYDNPALGGTGLAEISGGGYSRVKVVFSSPTNRTVWSLEDVVFKGLQRNQLTHFGLWTAPVNGTLMAYAELPEKHTVLDGWSYTLHGGQLVVSLG